MNLSRPLLTLAALGGLALSLTAHQVKAAEGTIRILVPSNTGGRYDAVATALAAALKSENLANVEIYYKPGLGGTTALKDYVNLASQENEWMVMGLTMVGSLQVYPGNVKLSDLTPLGRVSNEFEAIIVPTNSPYRTIQDVFAAFKKAPESIRWGGGSSGGPGMLAAGAIAKSLGVEASKVKYVPSAGSGQAIRAMGQNELDVLTVGWGQADDQIKAGKARALALTTTERVPGIDLPTLNEAGVTGFELIDWSGVMLPPFVSLKAKSHMITILRKAVLSKSWRETLDRERWNSYYMAGARYGLFISKEHKRVNGILGELGVLQP